MSKEIYYGNIKESIYTGYAGNIFGVEHDKIIEEGVYFIKIKENEYIRLEELLSDKKKKQTIKRFAKQKGEIFVDDLILVNDLVEKNVLKR